MLRNALKRILGENAAWRLRALGRFRWMAKYRALRRMGHTLLDNPSRNITYVLFDPELESYTYELANEEQILDQLAEVLRTPREQIATYAREAHADPELNDRLSKRVRWRLGFKRRLPLGNRLVWYVLVRVLRPSVIVETGILDGLGSLALLRALDRNAAEGTEGECFGIDPMPLAGDLVPAELAGRWRKIVGTSEEVLRDALGERRVGMLFSDSPHTEAIQELEFGIALERAEPVLMLADGSGGQVPTLRRLAEERGGEYHAIPVQPLDHIYPPWDFTFAIFRQ